MKNIGTYQIYLTGSRKRIRRVVYTDGEKYTVIWYGKHIEVKRDEWGFYTVESY